MPDVAGAAAPYRRELDERSGKEEEMTRRLTFFVAALLAAATAALAFPPAVASDPEPGRGDRREQQARVRQFAWSSQKPARPEDVSYIPMAWYPAST